MSALGFNPSTWASWKPFGIGEERPNNFFEVFRAIRENADELPYAWRILNQGVCDGCALGVAGFHDWTLDGIHLCNIRLRLLRLNTMGALPDGALDDVEALRARSGGQLRDMGRLAYPMVRPRGARGFSRISWDAAMDLTADAIRAAGPDRVGFYMTSRGIPNETYYAAQKAVRAMGSNSIDNAARVCHSPSTGGLKHALGVGATTCSYSDWMAADLIVFIGCNPANNQPVTTKYMYEARKAGTRMVLVNPFREPGMERYWIPSVVESAVFGTRLADETFMVNIGGDLAFLNGAIKHMVETGTYDDGFVREYTVGFEALKATLDDQSWETLESASGTDRREMQRFGGLVAGSDRVVFVWSMGVTQHEFGEDNVRAIVNLALTGGHVGREGCGLMPIRGHSGVQGGAEMGAYATVLPGGGPITPEGARRLSERWDFEVPDAPGLTAPRMLAAAHDGELDVLYSVGGNFLEVMPEPDVVEAALARVPLRVHQDIVLSSQMFVDSAETVLLLPAATRYEIPGGVTQTSTERRVMFSPEIPGRRIGEARPEWEVFLDLARRVRPELTDRLTFNGTAEIRQEIAEVIPYYDGIQHLQAAGDQFQYGGPHLCAGWQFDTPDGKAHFTPVGLPETDVPDGLFRLTTRRGKQFNSMVHESRDALTGATRKAVLMSAADADRLGLADGAPVELSNEIGSMRGAVKVAPVKPGNLEVHWPEGNVLIDHRRLSREVDMPHYGAVVAVQPLADASQVEGASP